jgi:membrane protein DedA with SNARE-associated domain
MPFEILIQKFGYLTILIGAFLEGETILIIGGFAAHQGYLILPYVIFAAFIGTLFGDQLFFFIGRFKGKQFLNRRPKRRLRAEKAQRLLERHHTLVIIGFRFIYGIRTVTPFVLGMSNVKTWRFVVFNVLSAAVWATAVGTAGYFFGVTIDAIIEDIKHYERIIILGIAILGLFTWGIRFLRKKNRRRELNS